MVRIVLDRLGRGVCQPTGKMEDGPLYNHPSVTMMLLGVQPKYVANAMKKFPVIQSVLSIYRIS